MVYAPTVDEYNKIVFTINKKFSKKRNYSLLINYLSKNWLNCKVIWNLSQINEQHLEIEQYTNNVAERAFRTLKQTVAKGQTKFSNEEFIDSLTVETQLFFEGREEDKKYRKPRIYLKMKYEEEEEEEEIIHQPTSYYQESEILVDGHLVNLITLTCSCGVISCNHIASFFRG